MKLLIDLSSLDKRNLETVINKIQSLAEKKGIKSRIIRKKTLRKRIPNSEYEIWKHRVLVKVFNPTESFCKRLRFLYLPRTVKGLIVVER